MPSSVSRNAGRVVMASPPLENFQWRVMASPTTKSAFLLAGELLQKPRSICRSGLAFGPPLQKKGCLYKLFL